MGTKKRRRSPFYIFLFPRGQMDKKPAFSAPLPVGAPVTLTKTTCPIANKNNADGSGNSIQTRPAQPVERRCCCRCQPSNNADDSQVVMSSNDPNPTNDDSESGLIDTFSLASSSSPPASPSSSLPESPSSSSSSPVSRRNFILWAVLVLFGFIQQFSTPQEAAAEDTAPANPGAVPEKKCTNCSGRGEISCELCLGTGFWRAVSTADPRLKYKGVVCPECEGSGILPCPVCLGTGEGDVRGLLRRRKVQPGPGRILQS